MRLKETRNYHSEFVFPMIDFGLFDVWENTKEDEGKILLKAHTGNSFETSHNNYRLFKFIEDDELCH